MKIFDSRLSGLGDPVEPKWKPGLPADGPHETYGFYPFQKLNWTKEWFANSIRRTVSSIAYISECYDLQIWNTQPNLKKSQFGWRGTKPMEKSFSSLSIQLPKTCSKACLNLQKLTFPLFVSCTHSNGFWVVLILCGNDNCRDIAHFQGSSLESDFTFLSHSSGKLLTKQVEVHGLTYSLYIRTWYLSPKRAYERF